MVQDGAIVTMADQLKVIYGLSNRAILNDLERPQTHISRSGHSLTLNIWIFWPDPQRLCSSLPMALYKYVYDMIWYDMTRPAGRVKSRATLSRIVFWSTRVKYCWMPTSKSLTNSLVENETAVSVVRVTFSESLVDCEQVQVDSIIQVDSTHNLQVDSIVQIKSLPIYIRHLQRWQLSLLLLGERYYVTFTLWQARAVRLSSVTLVHLT